MLSTFTFDWVDIRSVLDWNGNKQKDEHTQLFIFGLSQKNVYCRLELDLGSIGSSPVPSYRRLINVLVTSKDELSHFVFEMTALRMLSVKNSGFYFFSADFSSKSAAKN